ASLPAEQYLLYFSWQGLQLIYPTSLRVQEAAPALFVEGGGRDGVAAALNEDGSRHGPSNPAARGSVVRLLATGLGVHDGPLPTGDFYSVTEPLRVTGNVQVLIDEKPAEVTFAGGIPGMLGGAYKIEVMIPEAT